MSLPVYRHPVPFHRDFPMPERYTVAVPIGNLEDASARPLKEASKAFTLRLLLDVDSTRSDLLASRPVPSVPYNVPCS